VSAEAERAEPPREVAVDAAGAGVIAGYTVVSEAGAAPRTVALVDRDDGLRSLAWSEDPVLAQRGTEEELAGMRVRVETDDRLVV